MSTPLYSGIVKQVVSGDTVIIRDKPKDSCPNEKTIVLMGISTPKLGRKKKDGGEDKDEPFAWEAREYLREKLIGEEVYFFFKPFRNESGSSDRQLGKIFFPTKEDDIIEGLVANGLAKIKKERTSSKKNEEPDKLTELEEKAKLVGKGVWSNDKEKDKHVRVVKYPKEFSKLVSEFKKEPVKAIIEAVRPGPYMMMMDLTLLPSFYSIPFAMSGVKFNGDSEYYKDEAKFFIESRLLQQNGVQVVIEKALNNYVAGSVLHPKGNIAEVLLKEGFMCCDERTIHSVHCGAAKLRAAEKHGKDKRLRMWQNASISSEPVVERREYQAVVTEIINGEAMWVKVCDTGTSEKIFLSSIKSPKESLRKEETDDSNPKEKPRAKSMFDIPWLFEAREFLRKKLIGKKVTVIVDYIQPSRDPYPEKSCCTVMIGTTNIAEALVANGLATVIKHRERDDRSSFYDELCSAEMKAIENQKGLHSKGEPPKHRVNDLQGSRAAGILPMLKKADRITAIVEYVASGSRMRCFIPKDSLTITFLLSGVICPRASFKRQNESQSQPPDPFGDEALQFTKEKVMQREVEIHIESMDKKGGMVGTLTVNNINLALALVEAGLAELYASCSDRTLLQAQKIAKENKIGIWSVRQEEQKPVAEDDIPERAVKYIEASLSVVSPELHLYVHHLCESKALAEMVQTLQLEFASSSPVTYSKDNPPPKDSRQLCAAKFSEDFLWYRGRVEKLQDGTALIHFVDYGNKQYVAYEDIAPLPQSAQSVDPFAHLYALACVNMPPEFYFDEVAVELFNELGNRSLNLNVEYVDQNINYVTIIDAKTKEDLNKVCIEKGLFYVKRRREKKFRNLVKEYEEAQVKAKKDHKLIWEHGDARADDAREFGLGK